MAKRTVGATDQDLEQLTSIFRLLSDKTRLNILLLLSEGERNVTSLCEQLKLPQPTVSHHLGLLRMHNVISNRRNGKQVFYSLNSQVGNLDGDAIQVGHATEVRVENNRGRSIGYPIEEVDLEGRGYPVAIDTAGNVDKSTYRNNQFEEVDGKCFDLDGFHDGEVSGNTCLNEDSAPNYPYGNFGIIINNSNPDMQSRNIRITGNTIDGELYGGIFIIGSLLWGVAFDGFHPDR